MSLKMTNLALMTVMITTSLLAMAFHPTHRIADDEPALNLETMIPTQFGDWQEMPQQSIQIINPQQKEVLDRIYTQTLSRTYVNSKGDSVMLSIAYGVDQSDAKQLHYPEVCYPAQGFQVVENEKGILETDFGKIKIRRLLATMGNRRELITYWATIGSSVVISGTEAKFAQLQYGFLGEIPDGLIFRVSSLGEDAQQYFEIQRTFVIDLLGSIDPASRHKIAGFSKVMQ